MSVARNTLLLALPVLVLAGCSASLDSQSGSIEVGQGVKIQEYVGDGHGGTKPWPAFLPGLGDEATAVQPQAVPEALANNGACIAGTAPAGWANWFAVPVGTTGSWVITLQPTGLQEVDLYVLEGRSSDFTDGADCKAYSNRATTPFPSDHVKGGYAPDWVAPWLAGWLRSPSAYVAVAGPASGLTAGSFTIEADRPGGLSVGGASSAGSLAAGNSRWFTIWATFGTSYSVVLSSLGGDPDLYVYENTSTEYVTGSAASGGATVSFAAAEAGFHYIRVYAYNDCKYVIHVTSP